MKNKKTAERLLYGEKRHKNTAGAHFSLRYGYAYLQKKP